MLWLTLDSKPSRAGRRSREPEVVPLTCQIKRRRPLSVASPSHRTIIVEPSSRSSRSRPVSYMSPPTVQVIRPEEEQSELMYICPSQNSYREEWSRPVRHAPITYYADDDPESFYYEPYHPKAIEQEIIIEPSVRRPRSRSRTTISSTTRTRSVSTASSPNTTPSLGSSSSRSPSIAASSPSLSLPRTPELSCSSRSPSTSPSVSSTSRFPSASLSKALISNSRRRSPSPTPSSTGSVYRFRPDRSDTTSSVRSESSERGRSIDGKDRKRMMRLLKVAEYTSGRKVPARSLSRR